MSSMVHADVPVMTYEEKREIKRAKVRLKSAIYRKRHPERARASVRASHVRNKEHYQTKEYRAARCASTNKYRASHRDKVADYTRSYRLSHLAEEKARNKRYAENNRAHMVARWRAYEEAHREERKAKNKAWRESNPGARIAYGKEYYAKNRQRLAERYAKWLSANPSVNASCSAKKRARKVRATPVWADMEAIKSVYADAARLTESTGIQHDVDHIYPLKSAYVCGLHVHYNLQILEHSDNVRKSNHMPVLTREEAAA